MCLLTWDQLVVQDLLTRNHSLSHKKEVWFTIFAFISRTNAFRLLQQIFRTTAILLETLAEVIPRPQIPTEVVVPNVECPALLVVTPDVVDSMEVVAATVLGLPKDLRENMRTVEDGMEVLSHLNGTLKPLHQSLQMNVGKSLHHQLVSGWRTIVGRNPKGVRRRLVAAVVTGTLAGRNRAKLTGLHPPPRTIDLNWKCLARATPALTSINMKIFPWRRRVTTCQLTSARWEFYSRHSFQIVNVMWNILMVPTEKSVSIQSCG